MRVSIVIPTFNRAVYLETAISSALAQDYKDLEIVISDNASTDNTQLVSKVYCRDQRVKYFRNSENIGMVRNWQKAVFEYATGDWFLILSDDDILTNPHFVSQAMEIIKAQKDVTVVYSNSYVYDEALEMVTKLKVPFSELETGTRVFSQRGTVRPQDFALCNVLFNRKLASELKAFSNPNNLSCDTELFLRLCLRGKVGVVQEYSSIYRVHSGNLLKTAGKNIDLVVGSLDSLLVPLAEAERMIVDPFVIKEFVVNSKLKREIIVCLIKMSMVSPDQARNLNRDLQKRLANKGYDILPSFLLFNLVVTIASIIGPLFQFRRRLIYGINSLKRSFFGHQVYFEPLHKRVYVIE